MDIIVSLPDEYQEFITHITESENARLGTNFTIEQYLSKIAIDLLGPPATEYLKGKSSEIAKLYVANSSFRAAVDAAKVQVENAENPNPVEQPATESVVTSSEPTQPTESFPTLPGGLP